MPDLLQRGLRNRCQHLQQFTQNHWVNSSAGLQIEIHHHYCIRRIQTRIQQSRLNISDRNSDTKTCKAGRKLHCCCGKHIHNRRDYGKDAKSHQTTSDIDAESSGGNAEGSGAEAREESAGPDATDGGRPELPPP